MTVTTTATAAVQKAMEFDYAGYGWGEPGKGFSSDTMLENMMNDSDLWQDLRNLLISMWYQDFSIEGYLQELATDCEQENLGKHPSEHSRAWPRMLDIRFIHATFLVWAAEQRDKLTEFTMGMSLCPIHFIDWAICFDDEDPECAQVRTIFPHSHDT